MHWAVPLTITIVAAAVATLWQRFIQRDSKFHPLGFSITAGCMAAIILSLIVVVRGLDTRWELLSFSNFFLSTVLWLFVNVFMCLSLQRAEASQFVIIFNTRVLWSLAVTVLFLHESLSLMIIVGTLLLVGGAIIAVWEKDVNLKSPRIVYSILTAIFAGVALANDGIILAKGYDVYSYYLFNFLLPQVFLAVFSPAGRRSAVKIIRTPKIRLQLFLLSVLYVTSSVTLLIAFQLKKEFATLLSLNQLQTVLVVIGAMIFLKERKYIGRRLIAACLSFLGAVIVLVN